MKLSKLSIFGVLAAAALATGCNCNQQAAGPDTTQGYIDPFFPNADKRLIEIAGRQQAASAARGDATLIAAHFHGDKLNSLGEQKLGLMLEDDDATRPITVYVDVNDDKHSAGRRSSVEAFMLARGVPAEQLTLENGVNPGGISSPTAPLLKNMAKTDSAGTAEAAQ